MINLCDTCARVSLQGNYCKLLKVMLGRSGKCSFWTDDVAWEANAEAAVAAYRVRGEVTAS